MPKNISEYIFIQKLKALSCIDEIWLFGSRARGDNQKRADIDIALICPKATKKDWQPILDIVENADTLLKIDCLRFDKNILESSLYYNILKDKKVLYAKNKN